MEVGRRVIHPPRCSSSPSRTPSAMKHCSPSVSRSGITPAAVDTSCPRPTLAPIRRIQRGAKTDANSPWSTPKLAS